MSLPDSEHINIKPGLFFAGLNDGRKYPAWRHHDVLPPRIVENTEEDEQVQKEGWKEIKAPMIVNPRFLNWHWDLEDFSADQMVLFAKEEFEIDLPVELGKEKLFRAIWELTKAAPVNQNRIVLWAQTIEMHYDETLEEIKRQIATGDAETTTEEFYA